MGSLADSGWPVFYFGFCCLPVRCQSFATPDESAGFPK
jgi:hypothetical protein